MFSLITPPPCGFPSPYWGGTLHCSNTVWFSPNVGECRRRREGVKLKIPPENRAVGGYKQFDMKLRVYSIYSRPSNQKKQLEAFYVCFRRISNGFVVPSEKHFLTKNMLSKNISYYNSKKKHQPNGWCFPFSFFVRTNKTLFAQFYHIFDFGI